MEHLSVPCGPNLLMSRFFITFAPTFNNIRLKTKKSAFLRFREMDKIQAGKYVELVYEIFVMNGDEKLSVFKFNKEHPDAFVFGLDLALIEGFQNHIMGLEQGESFDFTLKPEEAFGVKNPELIYELEKEIFHVDGKFDSENIRPGAVVPMMTQEGMRIEGTVTNVTDDKVVMDFNHQLAGETVRYSGFVQLVRDATPEELQPKHHGCGCGCEECGDGCGHDHNHGEGCDCSCGGC